MSGRPKFGEPDLLIDVTGSRKLRHALENNVAYYTTPEAATWIAEALKRAQGSSLEVKSVQRWLA